MRRHETAKASGFETIVRDDPELFFDRAPCGYLSITPGGLVVNVNRTFSSWTGYEREELVGLRRFVELLTIGGRMYYDTHFSPMLLMQDFVREIALELVCADGRRLPILVNASLDRDDKGEPTLIRVAVLDATERHRYEMELLAAKQRAEESEGRARVLAHTLQQAFIPPVPPVVPGLDVAGVYRPAGAGDEVGGDFYDVFQVNEDQWVVTLGDVAGKGVDAAVVTSLVRHTLRSAAVVHPDPADALRELNDVLGQHDSGRFCTVAVLHLRREGSAWRLDLALAGHPHPLLRAPGGVHEFVGVPGTAVGLVESPELVTTSLDAPPGSTLVLYTDGVTEARGPGGFYGDDRLRTVVDASNGVTADDLAHDLLRDVLTFQEQQPRDDIAIVVLRVPEGSEGDDREA